MKSILLLTCVLGGVLNSLALQKYGVSAEAETPPGGIIVRKPGTQEPWGLIMETAFLPVFEQTEPMTAQQEVDWTRAGQMLYAEAGVTTAHEGATHLPQIQTIKRASEAGANPIYPAPENRAQIVVKSSEQSGKIYSWKAYACDMADVNQTAGRLWTLRRLNGVEVSVAKPPTLQFAKGKLAIFGGVNRMTGAYALVDDRVVMGG